MSRRSRTRGGVPGAAADDLCGQRSVPHARGCSAPPGPVLPCLLVGPARAGVFPTGRATPTRSVCRPRTRGGVPPTAGAVRPIGASAPHARGCSERVLVRPGRIAVGPARAGVFLRSTRGCTGSSRRPRTRGSVPPHRPWTETATPSAPHARGVPSPGVSSPWATRSAPHVRRVSRPTATAALGLGCRPRSAERFSSAWSTSRHRPLSALGNCPAWHVSARCRTYTADQLGYEAGPYRFGTRTCRANRRLIRGNPDRTSGPFEYYEPAQSPAHTSAGPPHVRRRGAAPNTTAAHVNFGESRGYAFPHQRDSSEVHAEVGAADGVGPALAGVRLTGRRLRGFSDPCPVSTARLSERRYSVAGLTRRRAAPSNSTSLATTRLGVWAVAAPRPGREGPRGTAIRQGSARQRP